MRLASDIASASSATFAGYGANQVVGLNFDQSGVGAARRRNSERSERASVIPALEAEKRAPPRKMHAGLERGFRRFRAVRRRVKPAQVLRQDSEKLFVKARF